MSQTVSNKNHHTNILLGPPGTGKTTTLLEVLETALTNGIDPAKIGYISFTNAAIDEALTRCLEKFPQYERKDFVYFRTLHSLCFNLLRLNHKMVLGRTQYSEIAEAVGVEYRGFVDLSEGFFSQQAEGDRMLFHIGLARAKGLSLEQQYNSREENYSWSEFIRFNEAIEEYKKHSAMLDFNDMLLFASERSKIPALDLLLVDEAQDLSTLQWNVVKKLIERAKEVYLAGDDDQAIYTWAGADVNAFIDFVGNETTLVQSYRLPNKVFNAAQSLTSKINKRRTKQYMPTKEEGSIQYIGSFDELDISQGTWLVLARNQFLLNDAQMFLEEAGYPYTAKDSPMTTEQGKAIRAYELNRRNNIELTQYEQRIIKKYGAEYANTDSTRSKPSWGDTFTRISGRTKSYFRSCLKRGESIINTPRIRLSTIHAAKGAEADNVVLFMDVSKASYDEIQIDNDNELRVQYVGVTRTKQNLYLVEPQTQYYFEV